MKHLEMGVRQYKELRNLDTFVIQFFCLRKAHRSDTLLPSACVSLEDEAEAPLDRVQAAG